MLCMDWKGQVKQMSSVFSEVYGTYYNIVAKLLKLSVTREISLDDIKRIVYAEGYGDSSLQLLPALEDGTWKLFNKDLKTPIKYEPTMPLTLLQKRWLKTLLQDKRIRLFFDDEQLVKQQNELQEIKPLYRQEHLVFFDRSNNGDDYENSVYREIFRILLRSIQEEKQVKVFVKTGEQTDCFEFLPTFLEYSEHEDKFCLQGASAERSFTIPIAKITAVEVGGVVERNIGKISEAEQQRLVMDIEDCRNAMVRTMMHFSDLPKETEKIDDLHYRLTVYYAEEDEVEMVTRVLSFGPMLKVIEPQSFVELIKNRLRIQLLRKCR